MTPEDLQKNKAMMENLTKGNIIENCDVRLNMIGMLNAMCTHTHVGDLMFNLLKPCVKYIVLKSI